MDLAAVDATPLKRTTLAEAAYETLLEAILRGQLAPGEELSAVALADRFRVSRTPVTEALQRLVHDGLVAQETNRQPRVVKLTRADIVEIYEMRSCLESFAAERAARRLSVEALADLRARATELERTRGRVDWAACALDFDVRFHDAIATAAEQGRLCEDIARYRRLVRCFCRLTGNDENLRAALREHQTILKALIARKPAAARKAMADHIHRRLQAVLAELPAAESRAKV